MTRIAAKDFCMLLAYPRLWNTFSALLRPPRAKPARSDQTFPGFESERNEAFKTVVLFRQTGNFLVVA